MLDCGEKMKNRLLQEKRDCLLRILERYAGLVVAFSGGVDSTCLAAAAHRVLGEKVLCVTAVSPIHPARERSAAVQTAEAIGVRHVVLSARELEDPDFLANQRGRCYICKKHLFEEIWKIAGEHGIETVVDGTNTDDLSDYRPGLKAASELGIVLPFLEAGLSKTEIRHLSRQMHLPTWNRPSMACLATRIPYETPITRQILEMVDKAEEILAACGFPVCRVRYHGPVARIEVDPAGFRQLMSDPLRRTIVEKFRDIGFLHISLDMEGYVRGSMNRNGA